jgi:hypothetical protein
LAGFWGAYGKYYLEVKVRRPSFEANLTGYDVTHKIDIEHQHLNVSFCRRFGGALRQSLACLYSLV